jgi:CheY-like chemotaxis protein
MAQAGLSGYNGAEMASVCSVRRANRSDGVSERKKRVLVIEDDPQVVDYYRSIFDLPDPFTAELNGAMDQIADLLDGESSEHQLHDFEVIIATQGLNAIHEACKSRKENDQFSHAIVDMRLPPGIDGLETASCLVEMNPDIQITFVTAYTDHPDEEISRLLPQGYQMIRKPFSREQILHALNGA